MEATSRMWRRYLRAIIRSAGLDPAGMSRAAAIDAAFMILHARGDKAVDFDSFTRWVTGEEDKPKPSDPKALINMMWRGKHGPR